jgi:DNA-binding transcriptional regulator YiaG
LTPENKVGKEARPGGAPLTGQIAAGLRANPTGWLVRAEGALYQALQSSEEGILGRMVEEPPLSGEHSVVTAERLLRWAAIERAFVSLDELELRTDTSNHRCARRLIARRISTARLANGLTQEDLALRLKSTQSRIAHWETARGLPPIQEIARVARALNTTPNWVLTGFHHPHCAPAQSVGTGSEVGDSQIAGHPGAAGEG